MQDCFVTAVMLSFGPQYHRYGQVNFLRESNRARSARAVVEYADRGACAREGHGEVTGGAQSGW